MVENGHPATPLGVTVPFDISVELDPFADCRRLAGSLFSCDVTVVSDVQCIEVIESILAA